MGYFEILKSNSLLQPYYFVLKAPNHQVIATSETYTTKQGAKNGIESVQLNGATTDVRDLT